MSSEPRRSRTAGSEHVELAHFWQEGGGKRMIETVFEEFQRRYPNVSLSEQANTLDDHGMLVKSQILREDPPSVFVEWPGKNLAPYKDAAALRDLSDLWTDNDWEDVFVEGPRERSLVDGSYYGVPIDIHRMNNLFYHVDLAEEAGVDPEGAADPREFLEVLRQAEDGEVIGMEQPMKNPSDVLQLFANLLIGQFGAETYAGITQGRARDYEREIREAVELLGEYAELARDDAGFLDMVEANARFIDRRSVFFHQGDWMAGTYEDTPDFEYGEDWRHAVFPGTEGVFMLSNDVLVVPANAEFGDHTRSFLEFMASPAALEPLNRIKGSIPPREDVSLDAYPQILREQHRDFKNARHFPGGHAIQVTPETFVETKIAASEFVTSRDVDAATEAFVDAYGDQ